MSLFVWSFLLTFCVRLSFRMQEVWAQIPR